MKYDKVDRFMGAMLGLACGDAVGTTNEFTRRDSNPPLTDMVGGGVFKLPAGAWTDDTSMALCLATSLVEKQGFDAYDQMTRYLNWYRYGYLSSNGKCFDIGNATRAALEKFENNPSDPYCGSIVPSRAGNGSLMRLAPVVLWYYPNHGEMLHYAAESSRLTHAAPEVIDCVKIFAIMLGRALDGSCKCQPPTDLVVQHPLAQSILNGDYLTKERHEIVSSGRAGQALEAALWCYEKTDNFEDAILLAANLGDDSDTVAAITGQIAGAFYGAAGIPKKWVDKLVMKNEIITLACKLSLSVRPLPPDQDIEWLFKAEQQQNLDPQSVSQDGSKGPQPVSEETATSST